MLKTASQISSSLIHNSSSLRFVPRIHSNIVLQRASFHSTIKMEANRVSEYKKAGNRKDEVPKHEMVVFKGLMSEKRAFGDFRTVLHTGLYSQIVAMEVPVNGEIGDEVRNAYIIPSVSRKKRSCTNNPRRSTQSIRSSSSHQAKASQQ